MSDHFTDVEIHRWAKSGAGEDGPRVTAHIAECAECAQRYAAAIRSQPLESVEARDVGEFVAAGQRVRPRSQWLIPLAAAAVLVIALVPLLMHREEPGDELHLRGGSIQLLTPTGVVQQANFEFAWASGVTAAGYRIEIGRGDRAIAFVDTKASRLPPPPNMPPGDYWWRVSALDDAHRPLASSQRVAFSIRPRTPPIQPRR